jgi:hypothetical protein
VSNHALEIRRKPVDGQDTEINERTADFKSNRGSSDLAYSGRLQSMSTILSVLNVSLYRLALRQYMT